MKSSFRNRLVALLEYVFYPPLAPPRRGILKACKDYIRLLKETDRWEVRSPIHHAEQSGINTLSNLNLAPSREGLGWVLVSFDPILNRIQHIVVQSGVST